MALHKIKALVGATLVRRANGEERAYARYAANRLVQLEDALASSAEGPEFWRDVLMRLRQIETNGELA